MSSHKREEACRTVEETKSYYIGGYARDVRYGGPFACDICGGPKRQQCSFCGACEKANQQANQQGLKLADDVRLGYYAYENCDGPHPYDQMYRTMRGYKDPNNTSANSCQRNIAYIIASALGVHHPCMQQITGGMPTAYATIPSTLTSQNYNKPNDLSRIVGYIVRSSGMARLDLTAMAAKQHSIINPDAFAISNNSQNVDISHVLLIEDSWVTGATVQSAAAMLHGQGAERVTVYCIARIVDVAWTKQHIGGKVSNQFLQFDYQDGRCPWCLQTHPV